MLDAMRQRTRDAVGGLPRTFWLILWGVFINRIGTFVVPFLAIYLTQVRGLSTVQAGSIAALYGAGVACGAAAGGQLADRIGRRRTLVGALVAGGAGMIALGFVRRLELIAPMAFLVAFVTDMYRPAMQAAVADVVEPHDRVRAFGLIYWIINFAVAIGLTLAGLLATVSFTLLFVGDGLSSMLFGLLVWRFVPETRPVHAPVPVPAGATADDAPPPVAAAPPGGFLTPFRDRAYLAFLLISFVYCVLFLQHALALPLEMIAHGLSKPLCGTILALNGGLIVFVQPLVAGVLSRHDRSKVLAAGAALTGIGFGLNALAHAPWVYALGVVIWTLGEVGVLPIANAVVADVSQTHLRGRYQGAYNFAFGAAACAAPTIGSFVLQRFGGVALWSGALAAGLAVAAGHLALAPALTRLRRERSGALVH
jgi:MFS family permease